MAPKSLYDDSLALLTDLYQLTMAYGYWKSGRADDEAVFHMSFRNNPFRGGFAVACGLEQLVDYIRGFKFAADDIEYLRTLVGNDGSALFPEAFLSYLRELHFTFDIDAIPEGTVVFAQEPLVRVRGPLLQCQLLETALLNIVNFQTLIATKAARICLAAKGDQVLEFGLRRAHGCDGAVSASRAAFVGGCAATSNVLAGKIHGIPVRGTHAHSWVMTFDTELEAFERFAEAMPSNCVFLVDTYDTLGGVKNAIAVGQLLSQKGHRMVGIRLDSGDLAWLSVEARRLLDEAGLTDAVIVASNDLDEITIQSLKIQGAKIAVWGVGTKLVTAYEQPALGGVYKLSAIRRPNGQWAHKIKISDQVVKTSTPGHLQVRRFEKDGRFAGDMIYDELLGPTVSAIIDQKDPTRFKRFGSDTTHYDLLVPVVRAGKLVADLPDITSLRARTLAQLACLDGAIKRFDNPHEYPVGPEPGLYELKAELVFRARGVVPPKYLLSSLRTKETAGVG